MRVKDVKSYRNKLGHRVDVRGKVVEKLHNILWKTRTIGPFLADRFDLLLVRNVTSAQKPPNCLKFGDLTEL